MIGHVVLSIIAQVIGWMATRWLWSSCEVGRKSIFSWTFCFDTLQLLKCSWETQKLQLAFRRVSVFHPINLCNSLFIAFLCNYSVIRLSSVQFFIESTVFHCILPVIAQIFSSYCSLCFYKQTCTKIIPLKSD